jgi:hypothetical protein
MEEYMQSLRRREYAPYCKLREALVFFANLQLYLNIIMVLEIFISQFL